MRLARAASDGRVVVALSLSAGRCTAAENNEQRSTVCVVHGDPASGKSGGLAMTIPGAWDRSEGDGLESGHDALVVRTPFLTAEGGEAGTLPYAAYTQALAAHLATGLTHADGADFLTVTHGAAGSGKSIQLFGPAIGGGCGEMDAKDCAFSGHGSGLFSAVLERIFAAVELKPRVAVSVVEWRPCTDSHNQCFSSNNATTHTSDDVEDTFLGDNMVLMEAIDLLARTGDRGSPTGCFMEDYADIPATRYVCCNNVVETLAVLHCALRHSLSWQPVNMALVQGSADVLGLPDTRLDAERRRRAAEMRAEVQQRSRGTFGGVHSTPVWDDVLRPTAGANSHVLVTLLLRFGAGTTSVWRLWDLSGPSAWLDGGNSASRVTLATHTALSQMAHRYMYRDQLQGGWWVAPSPPEHIDEIIPLSSGQGRGGGVIDKVAAMIEASLQHTCSSVLWISSLRFDACYDDINGDVLEAAASVLAGGDGTNGNVIAELRRRRRRENLDAAARVIDMFAEPFSHLLFQAPCAQHTDSTMPPTLSRASSAFDVVMMTPSPLLPAQQPSPVQRPPLLSPKKEVPDSESMTLSELNRNFSAYSAQDATHGMSSENHNVLGLPLTPPPPMEAAVTGISSWEKFVDKQSSLSVQRLDDDRKLQKRHPQQVENDAGKRNQEEAAQHAVSPHSLLHVSPLRGALGVPERDSGEGSPLSPPSVAGTEHPEEVAIVSTSTKPKDLSWDTATDGTGTPSCVSFQEDIDQDDDRSGEVRSADGGALCFSGRDPTEFAGTVQRLLEQPLAQLQGIFLHHQEESTRHRRRVIAQLNSLLSSDVVTVEHLQRRMRTLVEEEERAVAAAAVGLFGPCPSQQTALGQEVTKCNMFDDHSNSNNNNNRCCSSGDDSKGSRHFCGYSRWGPQKGFTTTSAEQPSLADQKICFLKRQLQQLESENSRLRTELLSCGVRGGTTPNMPILWGIFDDILQRCSTLYAKKSAETDRMRRKYNAAITSLRRMQDQRVKNETAMVRKEEWAMPKERFGETGAGLPFTDFTNRCHINSADRKRQCRNSTALSFDLHASPGVSQAENVDAMEHLRHVLMRATTFTTSSVEGSQQHHHGKAASKGGALSIDRGSEFSLLGAEGVNDDGNGMYTGLCAFREAAETARNSALRALSVAKMTVQGSRSSSLSQSFAVCNGDLVNCSDTLEATGDMSAHDASLVLEREEANVYQAVSSLQREAAGLEHAAVEAMSRERQLLSRVFFGVGTHAS